MKTQHPDLFAALAAPFEPDEVKVRSQSGKQIHYVTGRTIMNRLDTVLGPENWTDEYADMTENSVVCKLSIRLPSGEWLTKCDAGGAANMADAGDDDKSMYTDAFKRAASKWGIGRYLYRDGVPKFVQERIRAAEKFSTDAADLTVTRAPAKNGTNGHAKERDVWGSKGNGPTANGHASEPPAASTGKPKGDAPRSGKALFKWVKELEQRHQVGLLKYLNSWAKLQEFPGRMIDWSPEQVSLGYAEATRKLSAIQAASDPVYASQEGPE